MIFNQPPITLSFQASKKTSKSMRRLFYPQDRPWSVTPNKKVAWRLRQKWFNRYTKPRLLKSELQVELKDGTITAMAIADVKIKKAGGNKADYVYTTKPIDYSQTQYL